VFDRRAREGGASTCGRSSPRSRGLPRLPRTWREARCAVTWTVGSLTQGRAARHDDGRRGTAGDGGAVGMVAVSDMWMLMDRRPGSRARTSSTGCSPYKQWQRSGRPVDPEGHLIRDPSLAIARSTRAPLLRRMVYTDIYHLGEGGEVATAKLFWNGRSQAVRLPKEFRYRRDESRSGARGERHPRADPPSQLAQRYWDSWGRSRTTSRPRPSRPDCGLESA